MKDETEYFYRLTKEDAAIVLFPETGGPQTPEEEKELDGFFEYLQRKFFIGDWTEYVASYMDHYKEIHERKAE
jgi:hypothetical protein